MKKGKLFFLCIVYYVAALVLLPHIAIPADDIAKGSTPLEPSVASKFMDIPVPSGFKLLVKDSYSFESSGVRVGVLKYRGKADNADKIIDFYKEQMPMYNWNLLNIVEYGERLMNFDRGNETCIINLVSKGKKATITISVGPKSQGLAKKPKEPVK